MKSTRKKGGWNWIKEKYSLSFNFIKESKSFIYLAIGIFLFFALVGFFVPVSENISNQILEFIENLLRETENLERGDLIKFIFFNNLQSSFFAMAFGIFLGLYTMVTIVLNGYILGFIASLSVSSEGVLVLWRLLPHGIFELPAIFIASGMGFKLSTFLLEKEKLRTLKIYLKNSLITFVFVVIPLLILAAIIEGTLISIAG